MDFRNICSKIDMDAIRAKIPALPDVMTQLKLPKSMSKLKSRSKIFRSSREDVTSDVKRSSTVDLSTPLGQHPLAIPSSEFVNHTPQRISTISSLVDQQGGGMGRRGRPPGASTKRKHPQQQDESFYRSAGGIDDYCPSPLHRTTSIVHDLPMSPGGRAINDDSAKLSFVERMQKGYKDVSDFRFKSIFVKKTVVRQDDIVLDHYVDQYTADRKRQERYEDKIDRAIADNFEFEFKTSRRKSEESFGISTPSDSPVNHKSNTNKKLLSEHSGDESGMELSPPARKPGIASTRFSRVRKVPLRMSIDEDDDLNQVPRYHDDDEEEISIQNTLHSVRRQTSEEIEDLTESPRKTKSIKKRLGGLTRQTSQAQSQENIASPKKRRAPLSPQQSEEVKGFDTTPPGTRPSSPPEAKQGKPFVVIKENFKRFQKSFKLSTSSLGQSGAESDADEANDKPKQSKTQQFAERLKRFRSVDNVDKQTEDEQEREGKTQESPMHKLTSKLQEWKKSMKRKPQTQNTEDEDADADNTSPQKREKPGGSLMKKLKHIRSRKHPSTDDPDEDEEGGATYREGFKSRAKLQLEKGVAAASQMPQMTMDKIRETKKYFRKTLDKDKEKDKEPKQKATNNDSGESDLEEEADSPKNTRSLAKVYPKGKDSGRPSATRHYYSSDDEDEEDEYDRQQNGLCRVTAMEPHQQKVLVPLARAAWTNKSIHSDSMDTGDDDDDHLPRVLIHQDNSDVFESTIIIAVTRPISRSHSPSPYITELPPDSPKVSSPETKADSWVPNRDSMEDSTPIKRELSKDTLASNSSRGHSRKHSMDSSSEDSWIKDVPRGISTAVGLNSVYEMDEPWRVQTGKKDEKLYKTKSIDIFEKIGGLKIFDDFDDELKYTPVVKIEDQPEAKIVEIHERNNKDSFEQDSGGEELDDNPDDDNSSRVTRILKQPEAVKCEEVSTPPVKPRDIKLKTHLYGNSTESLMGNLDAKNNSDAEDSEEESDDEDEEDEDDDDDEDEDESDEVYNRPPSAAPSPPPSMSPPPPPLPQRQPSLRLSKMQNLPQAPSLPPLPPPPPDEVPPSPPRSLPPLPQTKPPIPPNRPMVPSVPKIPERTPSMSRVAKPLVKTSSLRLAYDEQVNPKDVGKVNKLISRFEPNGGSKERPRIIPRIPYMSQSSGDYSEDDEDAASEDNDINDNEDEDKEDKQNEINTREKSLENTPTNKPKMQKSFSIDVDNIPLELVNNNLVTKNEELPISARKSIKTSKPPEPPIKEATPTPTPPPRQEAPSPLTVPSISISSISQQSDQNSNFSQPSSEYGSPMAYPSSRIGSTEVTPLSSPKDMVFMSSRRSRRSMTRDDERYFSFDSDEENSYYSISSTNSNRYIVDL